MLYLSYLVLVAFVVGSSILAARYVDMLDKRTGVSSALIGGVLLAAVTSLPELFTSIAAVTLLDQPGLTLGNILGSNIFNLATIGVLIALWPSLFMNAVVSKSHTTTTGLLLIIYLVLSIGILFGLHVEILTIDASSLVVAALYGFGVYSLSKDTSGKTASPEVSDTAATAPPRLDTRKDDKDLSMRGLLLRFGVCCIVLIASSISLTFATDEIAVRLNMGTGLAGALFLGVATSLPEFTATVTLARLGNYNVVVGNIVGSNLFNFFIVAIADLLYLKGTVYLTDAQSRALLIFGLVANVLTLLALFLRNRHKSRILTMMFGAGIAACYVAFLLLSS